MASLRSQSMDPAVLGSTLAAQVAERLTPELAAVVHAELAVYYDLTVWVDAPREVCLRRLGERGHDHGPGHWDERWRGRGTLHHDYPARMRLDTTARGY
jgi:hypothetical protein